MKNLLLIMVLIGWVNLSYGKMYSADTLKVNCIVKDADTKKPVKARLTYESQPYGNKLGIRNDSTVSFIMLNEEQFNIDVSADGYIPQSLSLNYEDYKGAGSIIEEIELVPSGVGKIMRLESLIFPQGKSTITPEAYGELDQLVKTLQENPTMVIQLEGHTDFRGDPKLNMKLSKERVEATRDYLIDKGIAKNRIKIEAFGGTKPLSMANNSESSKLNRRVEVRIISL